jgi:hypothetical protein
MNTYVIPNALNGTYVLAIQEMDPKARIICVEVFPYYVEHLKTQFGVEVYTLDINGDIELQLDSLGQEMNIDWENTTVLMNPPYQEVDDDGERKDQASNLWSEFMYEMTERCSVVASVNPASWLSPSNDFKNKRYGRYATEWKDHFKVLNIKECGKHFPGVGSTFTYYIIDKSKEYQLTEIITENGTINHPFCKNPMLGYNNLTEDGIKDIDNVIHPHWMNDFGFSKQGYHAFAEESGKYELTGTYPFLHTSATKTKKAGKSIMSKVVKATTEAGITATFSYSNEPHPFQHTPKVLVSLSGEYTPVLDDGGVLGYTSMVMPILCDNAVQARDVYAILNSAPYHKVMSCMKWSGFVNIETLMRLKCPDVNLRTARKSSTHRETRSQLNSKPVELGEKYVRSFKEMDIPEKTKNKILAEEAKHNATKQANVNGSSRDKSRTDKTGEVFTASSLVIDILERLPEKSWEDGKHHLDPAMGNGQFLAASCIARAEEGHSEWLENTFGVDLMIDNVEECKARLVSIAIEYGYPVELAVDIVNENLHVGDTMNPTVRQSDQTDNDYEFLKINFVLKEKETKKKSKGIIKTKKNDSSDVAVNSLPSSSTYNALFTE